MAAMQDNPVRSDIKLRLADKNIPENVRGILQKLIERRSIATALSYVDGAFDTAWALRQTSLAYALWKVRGALKQEELTSG
jgi:hypothetical protein